MVRRKEKLKTHTHSNTDTPKITSIEMELQDTDIKTNQNIKSESSFHLLKSVQTSNVDDFEEHNIPNKKLATQDKKLGAKDFREELNGIKEMDQTGVSNMDQDEGQRTHTEQLEVAQDTVDCEQLPEDSQTYSKKKLMVQGMMDVALLTANANQLKNLMEYGSKSSTYRLALGCILASLCLQIAVGLTMIVYRRKFGLMTRAYIPVYVRVMDSFILVGVFLVTVLNVFIAAFTTLGDK